MAKMNVKKGDNVMVITGKDKGKTGEVMKVDPESGRIIVSGVNVISKHVKPRSAQQKGGIVKREGTIDVSNVMIICPSCNEVVRVGHAFEGEGDQQKKIRVCKKCGASLEAAKKVTAKKAAKGVAKKKATKSTKKDAE